MEQYKYNSLPTLEGWPEPFAGIAQTMRLASIIEALAHTWSERKTRKPLRLSTCIALDEIALTNLQRYDRLARVGSMGAGLQTCGQVRSGPPGFATERERM